MTALDDFRHAYEAGNLVFLAGAGASFDSGAPMPFAFLQASADAFLPPELTLKPYRDKVLAGSSIGGSEFQGIQPEVFYEQLLALQPGAEALNLWRALSPVWLSAHGITLAPNPNHLAMARYAERTGIPLFTTNFDDLFEKAAADSKHLQVHLPGHDKDAARAFAEGGLTPGELALFKLHGSIIVDGRESLDSLRTTMVSITASNSAVLGALERLLRNRRLVLVGYSGSDIDIYPALADFGAGEPPFWFDPQGDSLTAMHADRLGAVRLNSFPMEILRSLEPSTAAWTLPPAVDYAPHLAALASEGRDLLSDAPKSLLLARCLHSVGYNADAEDLLSAGRNHLHNVLSSHQRALCDLTLARVQDCTSRYEDSLAAAQAASRAIDEAVATGDLQPFRAQALRIRALYQVAQSRQQAIGPMIRLGDPRVDWRPANPVLARSILAGVIDGLRLAWMARGLRAGRGAAPDEGGATRALHAIDDHWLLILGRVVSAADGVNALRFPPLRATLTWFARRLQDVADRRGDYFAFAGAQKYIDRLERRFADGSAGRTFKLLRDPLNFALAKRDEGQEALRQGGTEGAPAARACFEAAREAAQACGSPATELKALVGLVAAGEPVSTDTLAGVGRRIQGDGYARYAAFIGRKTTAKELTCPPSGPAFETGVRQMETDDEEEPVHQGPDHRRAA